MKYRLHITIAPKDTKSSIIAISAKKQVDFDMEFLAVLMMQAYLEYQIPPREERLTRLFGPGAVLRLSLARITTGNLYFLCDTPPRHQHKAG